MEKPVDIHPDFKDFWSPRERAKILEIKSRPNRKAPSTNFARRTVLDKLLETVEGMSDAEVAAFLRRDRRR